MESIVTSLSGILILICCLMFTSCYEFPYTEFLKESFENNFQERCEKYPFVQQYVRSLDYPSGKQLMFVYQEPRLKNGGLGDRIGGLISAVALSLRFNRTLVLREYSGLSKAFRPYHPRGDEKFRWDNYQNWSLYNIDYANKDATEYDLWDCINNIGTKNAHCSMADGDVNQPIILYRSNRAYLCYWYNNPNSVAGKQLRELLGMDSSVNLNNVDLFEVAGCMLRLALWPTEVLWQDIDKTYKEYGKQIDLDHLYASFVGEASSTTSPASSRRAMNAYTEQKRILQAQLHQEKYEYEMMVGCELCNTSRSLMDSTSELSIPSSIQTIIRDRKHHVEPIYYQLGLHFRCGDHNYIGRGGPDGEYCLFKPEKLSDPKYLSTGNPYGLATCARDALRNHTLRLIDHHRPIVLGNNDWHADLHPSSSLTKLSLRSNNSVINHRRLRRATVTNPPSLRPQFMLVFVASDNELAAKQLGQLTGYPFTLFSPKGCHVELDPSESCHLFTVTQWFILAMSNVISTQTLEYNDAPTSSFSRYAGIYGLKYDPFRNGRICAQSKTNRELQLLPQSNWFC